jgi:hypothetical protein
MNLNEYVLKSTGFKLTFLMLFFFLNSNAQMVKNQDFFLKDSTAGKASYEVSKNKRKDSKNGKFEFNHTQIDTLTKIIKSISFAGNFQDNIKNKDWKFSSTELISGKSSVVKDYELVRETSGTEFMIQGNFVNGKADKKWSVVKHQVVNSVVGDTIFYLKTQFNQGHLTGDLTSYNDRLSIKGQFDGKSLVDGHWIMNHKTHPNVKVSENRIYENGVFKSHFFMIDNQQVLVKHVGLDVIPDLENEVWVDFPVSQEYFNIISFANTGYNIENQKLSSAAMDSLVELTNEITQRALVSFGNYRGTQVWDLLEGSQSFEYPIFKLRKFEFTVEEKKAIKETTAIINKMQSKIDLYLNNPQLDIILFTYKELNKYHEWIKIHEREIKKLITLKKQINHTGFEFINRNDFFEIINPKLDFPKQFSYQFKDETFTSENSMNSLEIIQKYDWKALQKNIEIVHQDLDATLEKAQTFLSKYKKQTALLSLEKLLIEKRDSVYTLFNIQSKNEGFNEYHSKISPLIVEFTNQNFTEYASKSLEEKKETIDSHVQCMDNVLTLYEKWKDIPRRLARLDELYTRTTFNPYTFTNMDERVKARLYETYEEILLPYFLEPKSLVLDCENILASAYNFEILYKKMVDFREQDTKILERQLRRVKDPKELIEILNLDIK